MTCSEAMQPLSRRVTPTYSAVLVSFSARVNQWSRNLAYTLSKSNEAFPSNAAEILESGPCSGVGLSSQSVRATLACGVGHSSQL